MDSQIIKNSDIISALSWWNLAGHDLLCDDETINWLEADQKPAPATLRAETSIAAQPAKVDLPQTLADIEKYLIDSSKLEQLGARRVSSTLVEKPNLIILTDMPDNEDFAQARLFSGASGQLLHNMLAAIGVSADQLSIMSLFPGRGSTQEVARALMPELKELAIRRITLSAPKACLLMGDMPCRAFGNMPLVQARKNLRLLKHKSGNLQAVATFHPRFLLDHGERKAQAWQDLLALKKVLAL